jgi:hypothetical protein
VVIARYLDAGVFYVQNPNNLPRIRTALAGHINHHGSIDVAFANGGITGPGGHPQQIAARMALADQGCAFFYTAGAMSGLEPISKALRATQPDFVKVYLLYSDEYERRVQDPTSLRWRGIDPALVPRIVQLIQPRDARGR